MHGRRLLGEQLQQAHPFVLAVPRRKRNPEDALGIAVMSPIEKAIFEIAPTIHSPAGEDARDIADVLLAVAAIHSERVQLHQLAGIVLVDPLRHPRLHPLDHRRVRLPCPPEAAGRAGPPREPPAPGRRLHPPRCEGLHRGAIGDAFDIIQIEEHGRTLRRGRQQRLEATEHIRPDGVLEVVGEVGAIEPLADEDVEMVGPEIGEDFSQLVIR